MKWMVLFLGILLGFLPIAEAQSNNLEQLVPSNPFFVAQNTNVSQTIQALKETWLGQVFVHPETQLYLKPVLEKMNEGVQQLEQALNLSCAALLENFSGQVLFSVIRFSPQAGPQSIEALFAAQITNPELTQSLLQKITQAILEDNPSGAVLSNPVIAGVSTTCLTDSRDNVDVIAGILNNQVLLITVGRLTFEQAVLRYSQNGESLANAESYQTVKANLTNGHLAGMAYLNLEALFQEFASMIPPPALSLIERLGLRSIRAAGFSISFQKRASVESIFLYSPEPTGFLATLVSQPIKPQVFYHYPSSLIYLGGLSIDWARLYDEVMVLWSELDPRDYQQFQKHYDRMVANLQFDPRRDLLGSLGSHVFLAVGSTYSAFPFPEGAVSVEVKNPELFLDCLKKIVQIFRIPIQTLPYAGRQIYYADISYPALREDLPFQLSVCQVEPHMVLLTLNTNIMKNILNHQPQQSMLEKPDFSMLLQTLNVENAIAVNYLELAKGMDILHGFMTYIVASRDFKRDLPMLNPALFPSSKVFTAELPSLMSVVMRTPKGVALKIASPVPMIPTFIGVGAGAWLVFSRRSEAVIASPRSTEAKPAEAKKPENPK